MQWQSFLIHAYLVRCPVQCCATTDIFLVDVTVSFDQHLRALHAITKNAVHQRCAAKLVARVDVTRMRC